MNFQEFCLSKADGSLLSDPFFTEDHDRVSVPEKYSGPVKVLIKNMRNKVEIFDKVTIPYIENAFTNDYPNILEEKLDDQEIPNALIEELAYGIFDKKINDLTENQRSIIKVLSVYICILN